MFFPVPLSILVFQNPPSLWILSNYLLYLIHYVFKHPVLPVTLNPGETAKQREMGKDSDLRHLGKFVATARPLVRYGAHRSHGLFCLQGKRKQQD